MYSDLAAYWPLLSPVGDYVEEAALFRSILAEYAPSAATLLELGSGGGNNAFHLKAHYAMTLVDRSEEMLSVSKRINPGLRHVAGDMRTVRLGEVFDAVFIHDAVSYMTTREDLRLAIETARLHCAPGGVLLVAPDDTRERFEPGSSCGGTDEGRRGVRYLEWSWDPDPADESFVTEYVLLVRDEAGGVRCVHDRHQQGVFPQDVWLQTMREAGFDPLRRVCPHSDVENGYELFIGVAR